MAPAATRTAAPPREARPKPRQTRPKGARPQAGRQSRARAQSSRRPRPRTSAARRSLRIRWERVGRVLLIVVLAVVAGLYVQQGLTYLSARSQADQQTAIATQLARQNAQLARTAKSLNNPATIQQEARALGMVRPGERPYVLTGLPPH